MKRKFKSLLVLYLFSFCQGRRNLLVGEIFCNARDKLSEIWMFSTCNRIPIWADRKSGKYCCFFCFRQRIHIPFTYFFVKFLLSLVSKRRNDNLVLSKVSGKKLLMLLYIMKIGNLEFPSHVHRRN